MAVGSNRMDQILLEDRILIEGALGNPEIKAELANFGYIEAKLLAGKALYEEVVVLHNAQRREYGEQMAATAELNTLWDTVEEQYIRTLKVARVAFPGNVKADKAAFVFGRRKRSLSGWLDEAKAFYVNILGCTDLLERMKEFGYTEEKLAQESALLDDLGAQLMKQRKETGEAQEATQKRDQKMDELAAFISDLRAIVKIALAANPQQLEKLGILARS